MQRRIRTRLSLLAKLAWAYRLAVAGVILAVYGLAGTFLNLSPVTNVSAAVIGLVLTGIDIRALRGKARAVI